ncbi:hypothetical protein NUW58_g8645 [Xylaria curta]|uniref:Uncharacterized protein n=1 Tax=Xylaria curta TaxID=42375 RepID=A0ACC1N5Y7_9PEZI|nr:hypothetical protein NUW58_g8645 [Xylaria curta]
MTSTLMSDAPARVNHRDTRSSTQPLTTRHVVCEEVEAEKYEDDEDERWTDLQLAAQDGDLIHVEKLLSQGADVNAPPRGYYGNTALQAAYLSGHADIARILISAGADVDALGGNNGERRALQQASAIGHASLVKLLLESGSRRGESPGRGPAST